MRFLSNLSLQNIVAVLSRGAAPVDGMVWVEPRPAAQSSARKQRETGSHWRHDAAAYSARC